MASPSNIAGRIESLLKARYRQIPRDENEKILDALLKLFFEFQEKNTTCQEILQRAADVIHRVLPFQEIALGIRNPKDGLFRYDVILGFTKDAEEHLKSQAYTMDEMIALDRNPGVRVSKLIELTIAEAPIRKSGDEAQFNRPNLISTPRKSEEDFAFGDYMDIFIRDMNNDVIGFIEVSGPRDWKMPSASRMKWLELFAMIIGSIIECKSDDRTSQ